jgi:hypothetical protein
MTSVFWQTAQQAVSFPDFECYQRDDAFGSCVNADVFFQAFRVANVLKPNLHQSAVGFYKNRLLTNHPSQVEPPTGK